MINLSQCKKTNKPYHCHVQTHSLIYLPVYLFIYHYLFILNFCLLWGRILFLFCFSISPTLVQFTCKLLKLFKFNSNSRTKMLWKFRICEMKRIKITWRFFFLLIISLAVTVQLFMISLKAVLRKYLNIKDQFSWEIFF